MVKRNRSESKSMQGTKKRKMDLAESERDVKFNEDSLTEIELMKIGLEIEKNLSQAECVGKVDEGEEPNTNIAVPSVHTSSSDMSHDSSSSGSSLSSHSDDSSSSSHSDDSSSSSNSDDSSSSSNSDDSSSSSNSDDSSSCSSSCDDSFDDSMEEMGSKLAVLLEEEEKTTNLRRSPSPQRQVANTSARSLFSPISSSDDEEENSTASSLCIPTRPQLVSVRSNSGPSSSSSKKVSSCIPLRRVLSPVGKVVAASSVKGKTTALKITTSPVSLYVPTRQDLNLVRLSRHDLERFVHLPFFDRVATGCYVRVGIGELTNVSIYAVAEVIGLYMTSMVYNLGNTKTNKGLKVRLGNQERYYRMEFVSNQVFSDEEFHTWVRSYAGAGKDLPSKTDIDRKQADIKEAMNFKVQGPETIVKETKSFKSKHNAMKTRELAMNRGGKKTVKERILQNHEWFKASPLNAVRAGRVEAMTLGDWKKARNNELPNFEGRALQLDKLRSSAYVTDRKRSKNTENGELAPVIAKVRHGKEITMADPTSRVTTRPRISSGWSLQ